MTSLTVWMVRACLAVSWSSSASYLHSLTTLARHTHSCQRHRRETFVHRRRCQMGLSSRWRWCLSVVDVLWHWIVWLLRTTHRPCRQRHVTESHPTRHRLQHTTTRSHCHLYQSINQWTSQSWYYFCRTSPTCQCANNDHSTMRGYTWFCNWLITLVWRPSIRLSHLFF